MTDEEDRPVSSDERGVAQHVFIVSAAMVGVCLTLLGLVSIIASLDDLATLTDELLAADSFVFLISCLSAYFSLRSESPRQARRYERVSDVTFVIAMVAIVAIGAVVALRII